MIDLFDRLVQIAQLIGAILFVLFAVLNLIRSIISGYFFPIFAFVLMTILALGWLGSTIEDFKRDND